MTEDTSDEEGSSKTTQNEPVPDQRNEDVSLPVLKSKTAIEDEPEEIEDVSTKMGQPSSKNLAKLSFVGGDDEEDESTEFEVKKSNYSKRITKQLEKERKKRQKEMAKKDEQLRKMQESKVLTNTEESVRKRMERERLSENAATIEKKEEEIIAVPDEDHFSDDSEPESSENAPKFRSVLERGDIPDANLIFKLKKQRQQRRAAEEFISLIPDSSSSTLKTSGGIEKDGCEEEDDEEFDDDRIEFRLDHAMAEREAAKEAFLKAQEEQNEVISDSKSNKADANSSDSDDELGRWEQEQIMKGVGAQNPSQVKAKVQAEFSASIMDIANSPVAEFDLSTFDRKSNRITQLPSHLSQSVTEVTFEDVLSKLETHTSEAQEHLSHLDRQLTQLLIEEKLAIEDRDKLEEEKKRLEQTRFDQWKQLQDELKKVQDKKEEIDDSCTNGE